MRVIDLRGAAGGAPLMNASRRAGRAGGGTPAPTPAPTITSPNPSGVFAENIPIVGTLTANQVVAWSKSGPDADLVTLDANSGAWSIPTPDFETKSSYSWTFHAINLNGAASQPVSIAITDVNENPAPTITSANPSATIAENMPVGGTLTSDQAVTWSKSGPDAAIVTLNTSTGAWSIPTPDYETKTSYSWTFTATNANGSASQIIALTITDVDEIAPSLSSPTDAANGSTGGTISVTTNEANGTLYWFVSTSASPPSIANLKAGTGSVAFGSVAVTTSGPKTFSPSGLSAGTQYYAHFVHTDAAGNNSAIASADGFVTSTPSGMPVGLAARSWGAEVYDLPNTAVPRTSTFKTVGTDELPAGASITSQTITLSGSGGVIEGWRFTNHVIVVNAEGWTIRGCDWQLGTNKPDARFYMIDINAGNTLVEYCRFNGNFGRNVQTALLYDLAIPNIIVHHCSFLTLGGDAIKDGVTLTDSTKPFVHHCYVNIGAWVDDSAIDTQIANTTFPHFDAFTKFAGGARYEDCYFDLTPYLFGQARGNGSSGWPYVGWNERPAEAAAMSRSTIGLTNFFRADQTGGVSIDQLELRRFFVRGHRRGGVSVPFQLATNSASTTVLEDSVIEGNYVGSIIHPTNIPANYPNFTWNNLYRPEDGALYTSVGGATAGVPTTPFVQEVVNIGQNTAAATIDRGANATSHQYAISTDGGATWGSWVTAPAIGSGRLSLQSLSSGTAQMVKVRAVNAAGNSAESNAVGFVTAAAPATAFATALNSGTAYSAVSAPFSMTNANHFAIFLETKLLANPATDRGLLGNGTSNRLNARTTGATALRLSSSAIVDLYTPTGTLPVGKKVKLLITVDLRVPGTANGGAAGDVGKYWLLDEDGNFTAAGMTGTADTSNGTRVLNFSTLFSNLRVNAADTTNILNNGMAAAAIRLGNGATPFTLPAPADKAAFEALFADANVEATLAAWDLFWGAPHANGVGASDGSTANSWNATGGLDNRGTVAGKPLVKQAGTYTAG